ncbi:MAG TPA: hypothetical protein VN622_00425 [Clostridia bacterium]|nr:hypothetical protein [Clostridia bacterium]
MKSQKWLCFLLLASSFVLAQAGAPNTNSPGDMSAILTELKQLHQAIADQQKQISQQQQEIEKLRQQQSVAPREVSGNSAASPRLINAVSHPPIASSTVSASVSTATPQTTGPSAPAASPVAAVAPVRVFPVDPPKKEGFLPDITIGNKIRIKPYGFLKASAIYDTASPYGNDFPLPGFIGDANGPDKQPEFHIKARSLRLGANFEWPDLSPNVIVTGKFEMDFEGNFTRVNNRNISAIRSSMPSIRLGYGRVDWATTDKTTLFALFGQDWTPFGSSTLPNLLESTGLGIGFGTLYERAPQVRVGVNRKLGGERKWAIQPEFAVVLPVFANLPANLADQLGYGERQGTDAGRPEIQGRLVTQFQLDKAKGVPPAQIIVSGMQGERTAIVLASGVPLPFTAAFPAGARVTTTRYGYTGEVQLPTRFFTLTAKYYNGTDLRFYFAGQLYTQFNDTTGMIALAPALSVDGASTLAFGLLNGVPVVAPQRPARSQGGFVNLGLPLSRWANAAAEGRNAGWTMYLHYGFDQVLARDVRRFGGGRAKSDLGSAQLQYKLNNWVTFAVEESLYRTRAIPLVTTGTFPLFQGRPMREINNIRSEFGTIFNF